MKDIAFSDSSLLDIVKLAYEICMSGTGVEHKRI